MFLIQQDTRGGLPLNRHSRRVVCPAFTLSCSGGFSKRSVAPAKPKHSECSDWKSACLLQCLHSWLINHLTRHRAWTLYIILILKESFEEWNKVPPPSHPPPPIPRYSLYCTVKVYHFPWDHYCCSSQQTKCLRWKQDKTQLTYTTRSTSPCAIMCV